MQNKNEQQQNTQSSSVQDYPLTGSLPKKEAVEETLSELRQEKKDRENAKKQKSKARKFLDAVSYPVVAPVKGIASASKKARLPLMPKMVMLFSGMFLALLIGYATFILIFVSRNFDYDYYYSSAFTNLIIFSIVIIVLSIAVFAALTGVFASIMLGPIRRITQNLDLISTDDLSKRLEPVDKQREFIELTSRINGLLSDIETTFNRQESFIADASHELKTPISVIVGYANLLQRWGSKREDILSEGIDAIARESQNMRVMAEKLLLLARIGNISTQVTKFDLDKVLGQMVGDYFVASSSHNINYVGGKPILLETDQNLLLELVRALTDNALRYTPEGGRIEVRSFMAGDDTVKITVRDSGIGIDKKDLPFIFDRFFRCDRARGRENGGTGLGLTIAKSIAETLGGELSVDSVLDAGTMFTFTLQK